MNNFFNTVILDNTVGAYMLTLAGILLIIMFERYVAKVIAGWLHTSLKKKWQSVDRETFKETLARPIGTFLVVFTIVSLLNNLKFPQAWNVVIYRMPLAELLRMAGSFAIIYTFFVLLIKLIDFIVVILSEHYTEMDVNRNSKLIIFFKDFFKVLLGVIGIITILKYTFNYDVRGLLTGLGIVTAAIALALKENLENLIASFIIFFDKPFTVGDLVKNNNVNGTVERIGLRSTRIRTDAKTFVTVPNKQMSDSVLENLTMRTQRRADLRLEIDPATTAENAQKLVEGIREILRKPAIQNFTAYLTDLSSASILIVCEYYTEPFDLALHNKTKQAVNIEILSLMEKLGIKIAGKTTDLKIISKPPDVKPTPLF